MALRSFRGRRPWLASPSGVSSHETTGWRQRGVKMGAGEVKGRSRATARDGRAIRRGAPAWGTLESAGLCAGRARCGQTCRRAR
jgi:hypothetical protein